MPPVLPPRPADLGEELCQSPGQDQPIYSESLDVGGDYEELLDPSDYCDGTSGGADYEELPAPSGEPEAVYDDGADGGEEYEEILPEKPSQSQPCLGEYRGKRPHLRELLSVCTPHWVCVTDSRVCFLKATMIRVAAHDDGDLVVSHALVLL